MVLLNSSIESKEIFPADYRIFNVGDNLEVVHAGVSEFFRITNRNHIPRIEKQDTTNWILAAAGDYAANTISDWLEPNTPELMVLALSIDSDRNMEIRVKMPSSDQWFGTKKDTDIAITPDMSPRGEPAVTIYSLGKNHVPAFFIKNPTEYRNLYLKLIITGYRYVLRDLTHKPDQYSTINLDLARV